VHTFAAAQPQDDSTRIPPALLEEPAEPAPPQAGSVFLEGNAEQVSRRTLLVPIPSADPQRQVLRLLADGRGDWQPSPALSARASARIAVDRTDDGGRRQDKQVDLREAALQWRLNDADVAEIGRVNLRQGAAQGFNPTDYFKTRTSVDTSTRDPQEQRVNRLGTVMLDAQRVGAQGSLLVALAPRLAQPASLVQAEPQERLRLGDTNGQTRLLVKGQVRLGDTLRPELLAFKDADGWRVGANLTQAFGRQVIGYLEYSGGRRLPLLRRALEDGVALGDLPAAALGALPPATRRWQSDLAAGATWTGENRLSLTLEFDYHQAGLDASDWQRWQALGSSGSEGAQLAWYLRGHANAEQEPLYRRNLFVRAQWDQAGHRDLTFSAFMNRNLDDGSSLGQAALEWRLDSSSRVRAMALFTRGDLGSQYGSDPARRAFLVGYVRYL
jgi:hypothetical protein